jgi:hypothetical protein
MQHQLSSPGADRSNRRIQQNLSRESNTAFSSGPSAASRGSISDEGFDILCLGLLELMRGLVNPQFQDNFKSMQVRNAPEFTLHEEPNRSSQPAWHSSASTRRKSLDNSYKLPRNEIEKMVTYSRQLSFLFGSIRISRSTQRRINGWAQDSQTLSSDTILVFYPSQWLLKLGFQLGLGLVLARAKQGWKVLLEPPRVVPENAEIFKLSKTGNVQAVETLIRQGKASIWDTDSLGRTPLHVSSQENYLLPYII